MKENFSHDVSLYKLFLGSKNPFYGCLYNYTLPFYPPPLSFPGQSQAHVPPGFVAVSCLAAIILR